MKHEAPVTDRRAAYIQDADDLERKADDLEARGLGREALHLRMEADELRAETPPRYLVVRHVVQDGTWALLEDGKFFAKFDSEAKARAVARAVNLYDSGTGA